LFTRGIDISLPITPGLAALLYITLLRTFPEPVGVYGAMGPHP